MINRKLVLMDRTVERIIRTSAVGIRNRDY